MISPSNAPALSPLRTTQADEPGLFRSRSWHKVKVKVPDPSTASPPGLVPASYLAPVPALRTTTALYDYAPARDESTGELENDEEMEIAEGEELEVLEEESEWVLCRKTGGTKGVGYVPATYIDVSQSAVSSSEAGADLDATHRAVRVQKKLLRQSMLPKKRLTKCAVPSGFGGILADDDDLCRTTHKCTRSPRRRKITRTLRLQLRLLLSVPPLDSALLRLRTRQARSRPGA